MAWTWFVIHGAAGVVGLWLARRHFRALRIKNAQARWRLDERRGLRSR